MPDTWEELDENETREIVALNGTPGNPHRNRRCWVLFDEHDRAVKLRTWGSRRCRLPKRCEGVAGVSVPFPLSRQCASGPRCTNVHLILCPRCAPGE